MKNLTFLQLVENILELTKASMSPKEIWAKAVETGMAQKVGSKGKTPEQTIWAQLYTNINKNGKDSIFFKTKIRPVKFCLKKYADADLIMKSASKQNEIEIQSQIKSGFIERDLHPLLASYCIGDQNFKAHLKTIHHENSKKGKKGSNEWLHPDLVGVYFPYNDYKSETLEIQSYLSISSLKLFSFEVKIELNFYNLRQCYFQAVSNSSWAHEGYLVVLHLDDDSAFRDEIRRLNNAFGIGVIKLSPENIYESEILFPSSIKQDIDWDTVNRLASENEDFNKFLKNLTEDIKIRKVKSDYDKIYSIEELTKYIENKNIK